VRIVNIYKWILASVLLLTLGGCQWGGQKKLNRRVTLWRKDKIPYGTYVAYENLKYIFPEAEITVNKNSPSSFDQELGSGKAYIIITHIMDPDESELRAIMNYVGQGNQVFISAFAFGDSLLHTLNITMADSVLRLVQRDSLRLSLYSPVNNDSLSFAYPGDPYDTYASSLDSQYTTVLGRDVKGRPDFIKFGYKSGGAIYLHFAPMAFTNFFLLHKNNKAYFDNALSYIPASVKEVKWDDYFRYERTKDFSAFQYILANKSLKWAFWLMLLLFLLVYLFESKRKQRIIPVISRLRNNSLDFVKTIGRLYYQRRDNHNLALKMVAHFQDHVRKRYNIQASIMDDEFLDRLSYKSGYGKERLQSIVEDIRTLQERASLTEKELLGFSRQIEEFYKLV
jgi:hypothetical protein